jgi:hypothetical protein
MTTRAGTGSVMLLAACAQVSALALGAGATAPDVAALLGGAGAAPRTMVVCAPGYPGTTATAQPTMDAFARDAAAAAGWPPGSLRAVYHEAAAGGLRRLAETDAVLALVSLPFFLQHETELGLAPRLQVLQATGAAGTWGLAARRGRVTSPAALAGFEIAGVAGYSPEFVRGPVLSGFGPLPATARITFTPNVLSALRRAAAGEPIAVVVDAAQAAAMTSLPFGGDLEIVARSPAMPETLLCLVGTRLPATDADALIRGLLRLHTQSDWIATLASLRMTRFEPTAAAAIDAARKAFAAARAAGPGSRRP